MKLICKLSLIVFVLSGVIVTFACGGSTVSLSDLPVYPGAKELKAGASKIGDTLKNNMKADSELRKPMNPMAPGGSVEQKGFSLPAKARWSEVKSFYEKELKAMGWSSGLGGVASKFVDVNKAVNAGGNGAKIVIFSKGKQNLTITEVATPKKSLILSLSTN